MKLKTLNKGLDGHRILPKNQLDFVIVPPWSMAGLYDINFMEQIIL